MKVMFETGLAVGTAATIRAQTALHAVLLSYGEEVTGRCDGNNGCNTLSAQQAWDATVLIDDKRRTADQTEIFGQPGRDADFSGISGAWQTLIKRQSIEGADLVSTTSIGWFVPSFSPAPIQALISRAKGLSAKYVASRTTMSGTTTRPIPLRIANASPAARWMRGAASGIITVGVRCGCDMPLPALHAAVYCQIARFAICIGGGGGSRSGSCIGSGGSSTGASFGSAGSSSGGG